MLRIFDGNSEHVANVWIKKVFFLQLNSKFVNAVDPNKCLYTDQINDVTLNVRTYLSITI